MIVICPSCSTKYNLADERARPGAKLKCTVCRSVFPIEAAAPQSPGAPDFDAVMGNAELGESLDAPGGFAADDGGLTMPSADATAAQASDGPDVSDIIDSIQGYNIDDASDVRRRGKPRWPVIVGLLAVLLAVAAIVNVRYPNLLPGLKSAEAPPPTVNGTEQVKNIALRNYRQYTVNNEKVGQLAVIEGKAVNNFTTPRELIKIEASLYDANGAAVVSKQQLCGVTVSLFQLQVLGEQELETALNNKIEILTNNTNVTPGSEVPFMVVFYNPPASVAEFGIKVVEARTSPETR